MYFVSLGRMFSRNLPQAAEAESPIRGHIFYIVSLTELPLFFLSIVCLADRPTEQYRESDECAKGLKIYHIILSKEDFECICAST